MMRGGRVGLSVRPRCADDDGTAERHMPLRACAMAAELVKLAGLSHVWSSLRSEACYYRHPDRHGVLRIATHAKGGSNPRMMDGPTIVSVTFPEVDRKGFTATQIENHIAKAIGLYLIRAHKGR